MAPVSNLPPRLQPPPSLAASTRIAWLSRPKILARPNHVASSNKSLRYKQPVARGFQQPARDHGDTTGLSPAAAIALQHDDHVTRIVSFEANATDQHLSLRPQPGLASLEPWDQPRPRRRLNLSLASPDQEPSSPPGIRTVRPPRTARQKNQPPQPCSPPFRPGRQGTRRPPRRHRHFPALVDPAMANTVAQPQSAAILVASVERKDLRYGRSPPAAPLRGRRRLTCRRNRRSGYR